MSDGKTGYTMHRCDKHNYNSIDTKCPKCVEEADIDENNIDESKEVSLWFPVSRYEKIMTLLWDAQHPKIEFTDDIDLMRRRALNGGKQSLKEAYVMLTALDTTNRSNFEEG